MFSRSVDEPILMPAKLDQFGESLIETILEIPDLECFLLHLEMEAHFKKEEKLDC